MPVVVEAQCLTQESDLMQLLRHVACAATHVEHCAPVVTTPEFWMSFGSPDLHEHV